MDTDHPTVMDRFGFCTRCYHCVDWKFLEPFTTPSRGIEILCPVCRWKREPTCKESDV